MNTRKQILIAVSVFIVIGISMTLPVHAGILDWFRSNAVHAEEENLGSFDQIYTALIASGQKIDEEPILSAGSLAAVNSPAGGIQKALRNTYWVEVSGYNSEVAQTDDSPFITAMNTHVRDGIVATNMFPFGTVIKFPDLYGDKIFVVEDRMNKRYQNNVDIWFADKTEALQLGRRTVKIEVIR